MLTDAAHLWSRQRSLAVNVALRCKLFMFIFCFDFIYVKDNYNLFRYRLGRFSTGLYIPKLGICIFFYVGFYKLLLAIESYRLKRRTLNPFDFIDCFVELKIRA